MYKRIKIETFYKKSGHSYYRNNVSDTDCLSKRGIDMKRKKCSINNRVKCYKGIILCITVSCAASSLSCSIVKMKNTNLKVEVLDNISSKISIDEILNDDKKNYISKGREDNRISNKNEFSNIVKKHGAQNKLNNSGYLSLEEDKNAEDAMYVFKNTEGLLKGTKSYPVRDDGKKVVYLTFDDGPSTENTSKILDILKKYETKATFFITGYMLENCNQTQKLLVRIVNEGHAIGNHTYSHDYEVLYPNRVIDTDSFMYDIEKNNELMRSVLGDDFNTRVLRFPGGYWSWDGRSDIRPVIDSEGYAIVDWNSLNGDAQGKKKNAKELVETTKTNVESLGDKADSIVFLMHDTYGKKETVKALPEILEYFKNKGFEFKTIK